MLLLTIAQGVVERDDLQSEIDEDFQEEESSMIFAIIVTDLRTGRRHERLDKEEDRTKPTENGNGNGGTQLPSPPQSPRTVQSSWV